MSCAASASIRMARQCWQQIWPTSVTDASGTFNELTRDAAWQRLHAAGAQRMTWFGVACELHRDWRNDVEGLGALFANHIPDYRNLITSYTTLTRGQ